MIPSGQGPGSSPPQAQAGSTTSSPGQTGPRPAESGYEALLDDDAKAIIARVNERINWTTNDPSRWALERQAFEVILFYAGIQWVQYDERGRRFSQWNAPSWFPTPTDNKMKPRMNKMQASLLRPRPQGRVRPNTNDAKDREAAKTSESMIGHAYDVTDEDVLRQHASKMACLTGTVVAEDYFDPQSGKILHIPRETLQDQPMMEPAATCEGCSIDPIDQQYVGMPCPSCQQPMTPGERPRTLPDGTPMTMPTKVPELDPMTGQPMVDHIPEGEIVSRVRMLFNFFHDPKATTLEEARWCGEAVYVDLDWLDQHFPDLGKYVAAEGGIDGGSFHEASLLALVGPSTQGSAFYGGQGQLQGGVVLRKYQEKKSKKYPNGLWAVVANGVLLYKGDLPIKDENGTPTGDFSYTMFRYDEIPGRFAGSTPGEDMVPLQRRINGIDSQIILNRKTLLSPWILAPKGSGLNPGQVAMRPGAVVLFNSIGVPTAPQVVQGTPLPAQVYTEREAAERSMDELARDAVTADTTIPPNMRSGISMHFLKEQADEAGLPRLERWGQWCAERDRKRLLLMQSHYHESRAVKVIGDGEDFQIRYWKGADIAGNVDVSIDPGSLIPRSKSIKTQTIFDMLERNLIDVSDPFQRQRVIEALDMREFDTEVGPDTRRACKENAAMDDGEMVQVNPWDNHEAHKITHLMRIKDPSYDTLSPIAQRAHVQHLQMHDQAEQQAQMQQQQQEVQQAVLQAQIKADESAAGRGQIAPTIQDPMAAAQDPMAQSGPDLANPPPDGASLGA